MSTRYHILFTIRCFHNYYENNLYNKFAAYANPATQKTLLQNGLVFKRYPEKIMVFYDENFWGRQPAQPVKRKDILKKKLNLVFYLYTDDHDLLNYTDCNVDDIQSSVFKFTNTGGEAALHKESFVSNKDLEPVNSKDEYYFNKPFGIINITTVSNMPEELSISFNQKATYWRYILVSGNVVNLPNPAIINQATKTALPKGNPVTYGENKADLVFISDILMPFSEKSSSLLQLVENFEQGKENYKIVVPALPNPSINFISKVQEVLPAGTVGAGNNKTFTNIFI